MNRLILSLFPGIGLLDRAFEESGFCVVRGPDILWGGDIRRFFPPEGHFWGIIGGSPCQDFSSLRREPPTGYGLEMLGQFARCVTEASPEWWLLENVSRVPDVTSLVGHNFRQLRHKYVIQRLDINQGWYCDVTRLRHIQFGSKSGRLLQVDRRSVTKDAEGAAVANDDRDFETICRLQGLPDDFDLPPFLASEKKRAVGNGVPLVLGRVLASAVKSAYRDSAGGVTQLGFDRKVTPGSCGCGCGRKVTGRRRYYDSSCRKRAQRKRDAAQSQKVHYAESA